MTRASSLRRPMAGALLCLLGACAQPGRQPLYLWEAFPRQQYDTLLRAGAAGSEGQIQQLQAQAEKARAGGAALPPGFRAHLGMLQLAAGNPGEARQLWLAEKQAFPESTPYMDLLLKRLEAPAGTARPAENPA